MSNANYRSLVSGVVRAALVGSLIQVPSLAFARGGDTSPRPSSSSDSDAYTPSASSSASKPPAKKTPVPVTRPPVSNAPASFVVNPTSLRKQVLQGNISLEAELNSVKDAKDNMNIARGKLLPSLNLGAAISSGPGFLLSEVQFLLPFLFPSNWAAMYAAEDEFDAGVISYKILELNVYSSALSMYYTVVADIQMQKIYEENAKDLMDLYNYKKQQSDLGLAAPEDLEQTLASADTAAGQASQLAGQVDSDIASMRQVMGFPLSTQITFDTEDMAPSDWETKTAQDAVNQAVSIAPENQQLDYLVKAAQANKMNAAWSFLSSATLTSVATGNHNAGFGNMTGGATLHFGFDYFPNLSLNARSISEVQLEKVQLTQQLTETLEAVQGLVTQDLVQFSQFSDAEQAATNAYNVYNEKYKLGLTSLLEVLTSRTLITQDSIQRVIAEQNLNQQRVSLQRVMLGDQFAQIKGCLLSPAQMKHGFWGGVVVPKNSDKTLDQACIEGGSRQSN